MEDQHTHETYAPRYMKIKYHSIEDVQVSFVIHSRLGCMSELFPQTIPALDEMYIFSISRKQEAVQAAPFCPGSAYLPRVLRPGVTPKPLYTTPSRRSIKLTTSVHSLMAPAPMSPHASFLSANDREISIGAVSLPSPPTSIIFP